TTRCCPAGCTSADQSAGPCGSLFGQRSDKAKGERQKEKPTRVLFAFLLCSFCLAEGTPAGTLSLANEVGPMTAPKQGPRTRGPVATARPRLEGLEAREVPAVIVGTLDPSFGTGGKETLARGCQTVQGEATDALGRVVVVG